MVIIRIRGNRTESGIDEPRAPIMRFHKGQRVICIAPHPEWEQAGCVTPKVGEIYTVRRYDDTDGLLLEEIVNDNGFDHTINMETGDIVPPGEDSFIPDRFRPLIERKTDISIFRRILDKTNCRQLRTAKAGIGGGQKDPAGKTAFEVKSARLSGIEKRA
jgi:hypothetical protein